MPVPVAPPAPPRLSAGAIAALLARGDGLLALGDIATARLFYKRAADAGGGQAALKLGMTFDPIFLSFAHLNTVRDDPAMAMSWYHRARELGEPEADVLLKRLGGSASSR